MKDTWTSWTIKIGPKAYKDIRPIALEMRPEVEDFSSGYLWWYKAWTKETGRWLLKFTYDTGPFTNKRFDTIAFESEPDACWWYDQIYDQVFLGQVGTSMSQPPKSTKPEKKPNKSGLKLV